MKIKQQFKLDFGQMNLIWIVEHIQDWREIKFILRK